MPRGRPKMPKKMLRKPRQPRQPRTPKVETETAPTRVDIGVFDKIVAVLERLVVATEARNAMLSIVTAPPTVVAPGAVKVELPPGDITVVPENPLEPVKRKRGRPSKAELEARAAAAEVTAPPASTTLEQGAEGEPDPTEPVHKAFPKACACGVREDLPPELHSKKCPVHGDKPAPAAPPPAPPPAPPKEEPKAAPPPVTKLPSIDDVRAVAISFAGKHGKEKLAETLKKYGADKLSSVPEEQRAALLADLQAGA